MPKDISQDNVADVVIVTALEKERDAILRYLDSPKQVTSKNRTVHKAYLQHENSETGYQVVVLCFGGMGNVQSATAVTQAIDIWNPAAIVLTGIMGGVEASERSLGDLIVAEQIVGYESGKVKDTGTETRFQVQQPTYGILEKARNFPRKKWVCDRRTIPWPDGQSGRVSPQVHFGVVASGEKVIADTITVPKLQSSWEKLIGVEMEGFGTALAVYQADSAPAMFMVKGISDWANPNKNDAWEDAWQAYAADVAAAYVVNFLKSKPIESRVKSQVKSNIPGLKVVPRFAIGKNKLQFNNRLGESYKQLATYFGIKVNERKLWEPGNEGERIIEWLEQRNRLEELPEALKDVERDDLVDLAKLFIH